MNMAMTTNMGSNMRIALIRHGAYEQLKNVPSALQPFPLTEEGELEVRHQARAFGEWLKHFEGEPQIRSYSALCERSVGAVANLPIDEIELVMTLDPRFETPPENWKSDSYYCLPFDGAESLMQAGQRVADHLHSWEASEENTSLIKLLVGHGASIRHCVFHLNVIDFCDIKRLSMFYGHPVVLEFTEDQQVQTLFGEWKVRQTHEVLD